MSKPLNKPSRAEQMFIWRMRLGLTQKEAGRRLGISQGYVSHIELSVRPMPDEVAEQIPEITDITPGEKLYMTIRRAHLTVGEVVRELGVTHNRYLDWVRGEKKIPRLVWDHVKRMIRIRQETS